MPHLTVEGLGKDVMARLQKRTLQPEVVPTPEGVPTPLAERIQAAFAKRIGRPINTGRIPPI